MSAFDRLLAGSSGSAAPSGSSQTSNDPSSPLPPLNKAEKRFVELSRRRTNALSDWLLNQDNVVYVTYLHVQLTNFDM